MIEIVTFTGVDAGTDLSIDGGLHALVKRYPWAEFGVLVGSQTETEGNNGIFPSLRFVHTLRGFCIRNKSRGALHLCGRYSRRVMDGTDPKFVQNIHALSVGFKRVQINLHGDFWGPRDIDVKAQAIQAFADLTPCGSVILQHRSNWGFIPVSHPKIEYLFDKSGGAGREAFHLWPNPPSPTYTDGKRWGYAGGLGPMNIGRAVDFAKRFPQARLWFDMEGRIRLDGMLSLRAVEAVCQQIEPYVEEGK